MRGDLRGRPDLRLERHVDRAVPLLEDRALDAVALARKVASLGRRSTATEHRSNRDTNNDMPVSPFVSLFLAAQAVPRASTAPGQLHEAQSSQDLQVALDGPLRHPTADGSRQAQAPQQFREEQPRDAAAEVNEGVHVEQPVLGEGERFEQAFGRPARGFFLPPKTPDER